MLSETIKALRKGKGLTQEELAVKLNVVRQTVSKWESGLSVPDAEMLLKLADALDTTVSALLGGSAPVPEETTDSVHAIAAKLELLNEQLARRCEQTRRNWRIVFAVIGVLSLTALIQEGLQLFYLHQEQDALNIIGGADGPTSILVTTSPGLSALLPILAGIVSLIGLYRTRRK